MILFAFFLIIQSGASCDEFKFKEGIEALKSGAYVKAVKIFQECSVQDFSGSTLNNIGFAYEMMGNKERAIKYYLKALDKDRGNPAIIRNLLRVILKKWIDDYLVGKYVFILLILLGIIGTRLLWWRQKSG
jgi:tetratricopeptide (TPR) repeat protein